MKIFGKSADEWITFNFVTYLAGGTISAWVGFVIYISNDEYNWIAAVLSWLF